MGLKLKDYNPACCHAQGRLTRLVRTRTDSSHGHPVHPSPSLLAFAAQVLPSHHRRFLYN